MKITEDNILRVAMRAYDNFSINTVEEFEKDFNRYTLIQRQFTNYTKGNKFNVRLLINHFICFTNVFSYISKDLLLFLIHDKYLKQLNSVLFIFKYIQDPVELDEDLVILISKEIK